ncbi:MAG TPA: SufD family Fe-S cluster assembly protein, partial [Phycisphaerae bacterium]
MTVVMENQNSTAGDFQELPPHSHAWVNSLRQRGAAAFEKQGFPSQHLEEWRDTNITPVIREPFAAAPRAGDKSARELAAKYSFGTSAAAELVFVNGHFHPELSRLHTQHDVTVSPFSEAFDDPLLEKQLGSSAKIELHPFAAVNTANLADGAFVRIHKNAVCTRPIHLLFLTTSSQRTASHPRVLVLADDHSESSVVETYAGENGGGYLTNAVTEIILSPGARLDHNKLQQEGDAAFHIALLQVMLSASSSFISHSTSLGSKLTRNDLEVFFGGEGAEATLNGLVYAKGEQHIDNHTLLHHEKAHCPSHELYKHVLAEKATAVFKGKIFVQKDAQKTDSKQTSKTLLLSDTAFMNSQP